ncbi:hypothetical protein PV325_002283 [Microctonus aethiopoides]|uniref:Uncharacterized protein n=1 Tax=Microctonus aethiopoides TaxID=144406 RepID=A0AA39FPV0_9HYME|nr:hypothetical protein PV325_002283 [Microctonus aethiopoides]KAK0096655.1 hypothetical protein PV326_004795 [Microctonus aethiopoides]KAK0173428.1 hypothetical protein PV328_006624 [Microctonus aethiopoides]
MWKFILLSLYISTVYGAKLSVKPVYGQVQDTVQQSQFPVAQGTDKPIGIVQQEFEVNPDGSFHNVWESENGIKVQEEGTVKVITKDTVAQVVNGKVSYTDDDGTPFVLTYTADENGFQPQGEHLPTSPPIPQAIARALEYIAAHPYVEPESFNNYDNPVVEAN